MKHYKKQFKHFSIVIETEYIPGCWFAFAIGKEEKTNYILIGIVILGYNIDFSINKKDKQLPF